MRLHAPFVEQGKADLVTTGEWLDVPHADLWSCCEGGEVYCE